MNQPYQFFFKTSDKKMEFPVTPGELTMDVDSKNEVATLISGEEINILEYPTLTTINFQGRFPTKKYPYSIEPSPISEYVEFFTELKKSKEPFTFAVIRTGRSADSVGYTSMQVSLESFHIDEDAEEGDDVMIDFELKEFRAYGVQYYQSQTVTEDETSTSTSAISRSTENEPNGNSNYIVKDGDTLSLIAKMYYDDAMQYPLIYDANKDAIEEDAKAHGYASSSNGHWIWAGLELVIPERQ